MSATTVYELGSGLRLRARGGENATLHLLADGVVHVCHALQEIEAREYHGPSWLALVKQRVKRGRALTDEEWLRENELAPTEFKAGFAGSVRRSHLFHLVGPMENLRVVSWAGGRLCLMFAYAVPAPMACDEGVAYTAHVSLTLEFTPVVF